MFEVKALVIRAKTEIVAEIKEQKLAEIKTRLKEIISAEKTLAMLKEQYENRLKQIENEISEIEIDSI